MKVKLYFAEATKLIARTMPFIWVRLGSYLILGLVLGLVLGIAGGLSWFLAKLWEPLGVIIFLIAFGSLFGIVSWAQRYYFYLLKAAHTAVMTEFIFGRSVTGGQIAYGKEQVTSRFRDTSLMFGVDVLVDGTVKAVTRTVGRIAGLLPIPGLDSLMGFLERLAVRSTTYVDEAILSRAYNKREENVWKVAQDGVVLYAQAWKPILANALALTLLSYVWFIGLVVIFGLPALAIGYAMPGLRVALGIAVIVLAWMTKLAVADAFSLAATLVAYHRSTESLEVNLEWKSKIEGMSDKFRTLGQKAAQVVTQPSSPIPVKPVGLEVPSS